MSNQDKPAAELRPVRMLTADEVTLCHSMAVLAQKHDGTDPSFTTLLSQELQRKFMEVNGLVAAPDEALAGELAATATALDAEKWRALTGCARVRMLGNAGCNPDKQLDPYGKPYGDFAHIGLELWTMHSAPTEPTALAALEVFVDKAVKLRRASGEQLPAVTEDAIAKSKRVLAAVDDYHDKPTQETRSVLRKLLMDEFTAAARTESLLRAPASEHSLLTALLERLRERCADMAEDTVVAEYEGVEQYGDKAAQRIRTIELDAAVREFLERSPACQEAAAAEQALGQYASEVRATHEMLDKEAPHTRGPLTTRVRQLLPAKVPMFVSHVGQRKWEGLQAEGAQMQHIEFKKGGSLGTIDPWGKVLWRHPEQETKA